VRRTFFVAAAAAAAAAALPAQVAAGAGADAAAAEPHVLLRLEPAHAIACVLVADTDGDGVREVVLVGKNGSVERHGQRRDGTFGARGVLQLRDPAHTLIACRDIAPEPGEELIVADPTGVAWLPWPAEDGAEGGVEAPPPVPLLRRARFLLRVGEPVTSSFVQDLDQNGLLDVLLPTVQGCQPYLQERGADGQVGFRAMAPLPLPVAITSTLGDGALDDEHKGGIRVPQVETVDLDGDGRPDLVTREGDRHAFHLQQAGGGFAAPIEVDLTQFVDSTPRAEVAPGSTLVLGDSQLLQRGDIDGDGIPDFVVAHRRKIWTFLGGKRESGSPGPQFVRARTQAVADDVSAMLLVDLDDDGRSDLLTFQVQVPGIGALVLGLVRSIDLDIRAVGYRSGADGFAGAPAWRRTVTLRIPPLLSLLSQQDELLQRFVAVLQKARPHVRGAFTAPGADDLAVVTEAGDALELHPAAPRTTLDSKAGRRLLRELLFEDPELVFDLDRVLRIIGGLVDQSAAGRTSGAPPARTVPLRDPKLWRLDRLEAAPFASSARHDILVVYTSVADPTRLAADFLQY
jgi:hypothetical protein